MLFVVAGSAGLYLPDLQTIFLSRIALGIAVAFIMTAQTALIGDYFEGEARNALTGLSARNFGGLLFILLAGISLQFISPWLSTPVIGFAGYEGLFLGVAILLGSLILITAGVALLPATAKARISQAPSTTAAGREDE